MLRTSIAIADSVSDERTPAYKEEASFIALRRSGRPEEVAGLVAYLLGDDSTYISGNSISIDGGWNC
jgi:NAD(P)-dependent dehydrogenase (short-subunit alcohol dehydrogenase family)